jgi:hypothetical protein
MNIVHAAPTPRLGLGAAIYAAFGVGTRWRVDPDNSRIIASDWSAACAELDRLLDLDYPRPRRVDNHIIVDGYATISYDPVQNAIVVTT